MSDSLEAIAAFVDGERVDPSLLDQALATPDGREYLIDLLALRELVEDRTLAGEREIVRREMSFRWPWLSLAAAVLAAVTLGGYMAGLRQGHVQEPGRSVQAISPQASNPLAPPAPTQVIRLQSGVNWQEQIGGH